MFCTTIPRRLEIDHSGYREKRYSGDQQEGTN